MDGSWRIVDQHWGSQYIVNKINDSGGKSNRSSNPEDEVEVHQIIDDFYFLTDPEAIVYTHLACEPKNQLLARPVKEEEFVEMALLKDAFFEFGMTFVSHPKCFYRVKHGEISLEFGLPKKKLEFYYSLFKSVYDEKANEVNGINLEQFVIMEFHGLTLKINLHLPKIGKYTFELYGRDETQTKNYKVVCEYLLDCQEPDLKFEPLPESGRPEWGINSDASAIGLEAMDLSGGIINARYGRASLVLKKTKSRELFLAMRLINPNEKKEILKNTVRYYTKDKLVLVFIKCPSQGNYILEINCRSNKSGTYENLCNYLVRCDQSCSDLAFYPESENQQFQTGDLSQYIQNLELKPISHLDAIIDPMVDRKEMLIEMSDSHKISNMSVRLTRYFYKSKSFEDCSNFVYLSQDDTLKCFLNFPGTGFYKLVFMSNEKCIYEYLINVINPTIESSPYPQITEYWRIVYNIVEPKTYFLTSGQKILFKMILPGLENVYLEEDDGTKQLLVRKDKFWEKDMVISSKTEFIHLNHSTRNGQIHSLLQYKVHFDIINCLSTSKT